MRELPEPTEMSLTAAALRLQEGYHRVRERILRGELPGRQVAGRWYVQSAAVEKRLATAASNSSAQSA